MRRIITIAVLLVIFTIVDNTLMPFFSIKGIYPNLIFVFSISYSIIYGSWEALFIGISAGLLQDVYFFHAFGINSLTNMITCVIAAEIGKNIFKDKIFLPILTTFVLSLLKNAFVLLILYFLQINVYNRAVFFNSIYNMVVAIPMYIFVLHLCSKYYMKKEWKF